MSSSLLPAYAPRPPVVERIPLPKGLGWRYLVLAGSFGRSQSNGEGVLRVIVSLEGKDPLNFGPPAPTQERQFRWDVSKKDKDVRALLQKKSPPYIQALQDGSSPLLGDFIEACSDSMGLDVEVLLDNYCSRCTSSLCRMRGP